MKSTWWGRGLLRGGIALSLGFVGTPGLASATPDAGCAPENPTVWFDALTGQPAPAPAAYDLVTKSFDLDNHYPINPMLGSQTCPDSPLPAPSLCGDGKPWEAPCTTQRPRIDNNRLNCPPPAGGILGGHANWGLALYEGLVYWHDHSYVLQDDDYSFDLYRDDFAGVTQDGHDDHSYLHQEFSSQQTINLFNTGYWKTLHAAVDHDGGKGGTRHDSWPTVVPMVDGNEAIVMGLFGLDCAHSCGSELHPVYAMAIHINDDPLDDTWSLFVRNWGDEGYCSQGQERIAPDQPFTFSFRFHRPGAIAATGVASIPADVSDPSGQHGTAIYAESDGGGSDVAWGGPFFVKDASAAADDVAIVTFNLPPAAGNPLVNGIVHMKWTLVASPTNGLRPAKQRSRFTTPLANRVRPTAEQLANEPEGRIGQPIAALSPRRRRAFERAAAPPPERPRTRIHLQPTLLAPSQRTQPPPLAKSVPDPVRASHDKQVNDALQRFLPGVLEKVASPPLKR